MGTRSIVCGGARRLPTGWHRGGSRRRHTRRAGTGTPPGERRSRTADLPGLPRCG